MVEKIVVHEVNETEQFIGITWRGIDLFIHFVSVAVAVGGRHVNEGLGKEGSH